MLVLKIPTKINFRTQNSILLPYFNMDEVDLSCI